MAQIGAPEGGIQKDNDPSFCLFLGTSSNNHVFIQSYMEKWKKNTCKKLSVLFLSQYHLNAKVTYE